MNGNMSLYKRIVKPVLFLWQPERIHHIVFRLIALLFRIPGVAALSRNIFTIRDKRLERTVFGLKFQNPVGLAAGFDKDALLFDELGCFGFGFVEIGTLTPKAQDGNEKPRMFRLPGDEALINRMGFNNGGADLAAKRLKKRKSGIIVGGNIGKNKLTPNELAASDYQYCFNVLFDWVDYFAVNVSSPNTPGLRALQEKEPLTALLNSLRTLNAARPRPKPILLKIAPDLTNEQLDDIIDIVKLTGIDGVIATNTTLDRSNLNSGKALADTCGAGGLSGKPLAARSTEVIRYLHERSQGSFPIIGVGGIHSEAEALEKLKAGASLIQVYTGFIYEGPGIAKRINKAILLHQHKK
jgi:dihydroorotate dehydrogenase